MTELPVHHVGNVPVLPTPDLLRGVLYLAYLAALDARIAQGWDRINERQAS